MTCYPEPASRDRFFGPRPRLTTADEEALVERSGRAADAATSAKTGRPASARKRFTNRANAQRSTGPKTAAGKARVARNACRHGLNISALADPVLERDITDMTETLAGAGANEECRWHAFRIAFAQIELVRVRRARLDLLCAGGQHDLFTRLAALDRYEARAFLSRKSAMRAFARARAEAEGRDYETKPTGKTRAPRICWPREGISDRCLDKEFAAEERRWDERNEETRRKLYAGLCAAAEREALRNSGEPEHDPAQDSPSPDPLEALSPNKANRGKRKPYNRLGQPQPFERGPDSGHRWHLPLAADHLDRPRSYRAGETRLAADENPNQRHAQRGRKVQKSGIDADHERSSGDELGHDIQRETRFQHAGIFKRGSDAGAARPLGVDCPTAARGCRTPARPARARSNRASGHSFSLRAVAWITML